MLCCHLTTAALAVLIGASVWAGLLFPPLPPRSTDPDVAALKDAFAAQIAATAGLTISGVGELKRDRDTAGWSLLADHFGSNPNTPYMFTVLPFLGFALPSPIMHVRQRDAVVLLARRPPSAEYFSFTTFAAWTPRRGVVFGSLADSVNHLSLNASASGLFAHIVTSNRRTYSLVERALVASGLPAAAINLVVIPAHLHAEWTQFETVLRLFRFANQTEGSLYLRSHHPLLYLSASHADEAALPPRGYSERRRPGSADERGLASAFEAHGLAALAAVGAAFGRLQRGEAAEATAFAPLMIRGLDCLANRTECLGDCPDAAYFGPHISADSDAIPLLRLSSDAALHLVTMVNHRAANASVYASIAVLRPADRAAKTLSKGRMAVRATPLGFTSFDWPAAGAFVTWAFTRNPQHCARLEAAAPGEGAGEGAARLVDGCTVLPDAAVAREEHFTYCERLYLNPLSATGPAWDAVLPARLYTLRLDEWRLAPPPPPPPRLPRLPRWLRLSRRSRPAVGGGGLPRGIPPPLPLAMPPPGSSLRFFHIIKTGGESLELHLAAHPHPPLDYSHCRRAATGSGWRRNLSTSAGAACAAAAASVSGVLCAANCECCASDVRVGGGFNGLLIRSPRAHLLSLFSHCHTAHTRNTWSRVAADLPQYAAEVVLRATEHACGSYCGTSFDGNWSAALAEALAARPRAEALSVLPLHNTQAHALSCSTAGGSLGQHFRVLGGAGGGADALEPPLEPALSRLHAFEWVGLTDLLEPSVCLLHYQANGSLPASCDCRAAAPLAMPRFNHGVERRDHEALPAHLQAALDEHTAVDAQLFAAGLRLLLGRLRRVEEATGASLLACVDWTKLHRATYYIPGLWEGPGALSSGSV